jgi:hypothetical protein
MLTSCAPRAAANGVFGSSYTPSSRAATPTHHSPPVRMAASAYTPAGEPQHQWPRIHAWSPDRPAPPASAPSACSRPTRGAQTPRYLHPMMDTAGDRLCAAAAPGPAYRRSPAAAAVDTGAEALSAALAGTKSPALKRLAEGAMHPPARLRHGVPRPYVGDVTPMECGMGSSLTPEHVGLHCVQVPGAKLAGSSSSASSSLRWSTEMIPEVTHPRLAEMGSPAASTAAAPRAPTAPAQNAYSPTWRDTFRELRDVPPPPGMDQSDPCWSPLERRRRAAHLAMRGPERVGLQQRHANATRWRDPPTVWDVPPSRYTSGIARTEITRMGAVASWLDCHVPAHFPRDEAALRMLAQVRTPLTLHRLHACAHSCSDACEALTHARTHTRTHIQTHAMCGQAYASTCTRG